jgi:DNA uptake protein ComE-like DNA-binding protein
MTKLDLNTASAEEFLTIPGVGDRMVREFEEYRPYTSILQFRQEIGKYVDEEQVAAYEEYVFVPIDPNEADEATLMQLPGVDGPIAQALIDGRPYADNAAFLAALEPLVAAGDFATAAAYLVEEQR